MGTVSLGEGGKVRVAGKVKQRQLVIFAKGQFVRTLKKAYNSDSVSIKINEFGTVYVYVDSPDAPKSQEGLRNVLTNFLGIGKVTEITGTYKEVWVAYQENSNVNKVQEL